jgi:hypothetical protein
MAAGLREGFVEADGLRVRHMEAGEGPALVHLHLAGGLRREPPRTKHRDEGRQRTARDYSICLDMS